MLTNTKLRTLKPKAKLYRFADAAGLCIEVQTTGALYWRYRYRFAGMQKILSLGVYPSVSLLQARARRDELRGTLSAGTDPSAQRKLHRLSADLAAANTFQDIASEWLARRSDLADITRSKVQWLLGSFAYPVIGARPIRDSAAPELLATLRRVESRGTLETGQRLKQVCGQVFRYAVATGRAETDPTFSLRRTLKTVKPNTTPASPIRPRLVRYCGQWTLSMAR